MAFFFAMEARGSQAKAVALALVRTDSKVASARRRQLSDSEHLKRLTAELDEARRLRRTQTSADLDDVKKEVRASLRVYQVVSIDTTKQEYLCEFCLELSWLEQRLKGYHVKTSEEIEAQLKGCFQPRETFLNVIQTDFLEHWYVVFDVGSDDDPPIVVKRIRMRALFSNKMALRAFPWDIQHLEIQMQLGFSTTEADFVRNQNPRYRSMINVGPNAFRCSDEFRMFPAIYFREWQSSAMDSYSRQSYPRLSAIMSVQRRQGFYIWKIFLPLAIVVFCSCFSFFCGEVSNQLQVTTTMLLAAIAFMFVVKEDLPRLPKLTYLDMIVTSAYIVLFIICIMNTASQWLRSERWILFLISAIALCLCILAIAAYITFFHRGNTKWGTFRLQSAILDVRQRTGALRQMSSRVIDLEAVNPSDAQAHLERQKIREIRVKLTEDVAAVVEGDRTTSRLRQEHQGLYEVHEEDVSLTAIDLNVDIREDELCFGWAAALDGYEKEWEALEIFSSAFAELHEEKAEEVAETLLSPAQKLEDAARLFSNPAARRKSMAGSRQSSFKDFNKKKKKKKKGVQALSVSSRPSSRYSNEAKERRGSAGSWVDSSNRVGLSEASPMM